MRRNKSNLFIYTILLLTILSFSCSVDKNQNFLSFFFDGVPEKQNIKNKNGKKMEEVTEIKKKNARIQIMSQHPDHKSRNCSKCHNRGESNFLKADRKKICFTCHKEENFTGRFVHGPVAVRACNTCHDPHQSVNRKLLLEEGKNLCVLCHKIPITSASLPCKDDNCLNCHDPHVSSNKFFLKKGYRNKNEKPNQIIINQKMPTSSNGVY